jgi:hypothetical protein
MKSLARIIGISIFILGVSTQASADQPTYPLACRGNSLANQLYFNMDSFIHTGTLTATMYFRRSASTATNLQPGECSWFDRTIYANEPTYIQQRSPWVFLAAIYNRAQTGWKRQFIDVDPMPWVPVTSLDPAGSLFDPNTTFTFNAFNDGTGYFEITFKCVGLCPY